MTMLLCKIGWMERYQGIHSDRISSGADYVKATGFGHEVFNFLPITGKVKGFVQTEGINISRLGAKVSDESIDNVTVVWCAPNPDEGGVRIVGWYENARVLREQEHSKIKQRKIPPYIIQTIQKHYKDNS
ncbi:MAG: HNH endonuclease, partial [Lentisphaerae bacterium]|nr:HNH endonuclease [Lentisphaerota bacterium]